MSTWKTHKIAEFVEAGEADIQTGPFGTQLRASDYIESGIPVINVRNIGFGSLREEKLEFVSETTADSLSNHILNSGDIVFARKGAVERHVFIQTQQAGWMQGSDCIRLRVSSSLVEPRYLSYAFTTTQHQEWMKNQGSHGATMATLNRAIISQIEFPLPSIPTQQTIIGILSAYDDLIDNNNRRIALLEESVHLLYREWFVHLRFPECDRVKVIDGIPEGWEEVTIADLYSTSSGGTPSRKRDDYFSGNIPWIKTQELNNRWVLATEEKITESGLANSSAKLFPAGTFIVAMYGATICQFGILAVECTTNQACCAILQNPGSHFGYAYAFGYFLTERTKIISMGQGSAQPNISQKVIKGLKILKPTESIMHRYNSIVEPWLEAMLCYQQMNCRLQEARDRLLPRLMNGSISA